jgi:high-affinity iron transporter
VLANFLIGLREGLEASLIVSILIAYLVKSGRRHEIRYVWMGVAAALAVVIAVFATVTIVFDQLSFHWQEGVGGSMSVLAAILVTWMIFWMRRTARGLKHELEGQMSDALALGATALATVAFVTVGREGLETATIMWSTINNATTNGPFIGAGSGIVAAVVLGFGIYRGAIKVNLGKFFTITGALLIIVAAGVLAYGIYDLQEAGFLPRLTGNVGGIGNLGNALFDISNVHAPGWNPQNPAGWMGTLLKGTVNYQPNPSWLQAIAWLSYLAIVLPLYLRKPKPAVAAVKDERVMTP